MSTKDDGTSACLSTRTRRVRFPPWIPPFGRSTRVVRPAVNRGIAGSSPADRANPSRESIRTMSKSNLILEPYLQQVERWPRAGRHILAQHDHDSVTVYQAYRPDIGHFAAANGVFGGEF